MSKIFIDILNELDLSFGKAIITLKKAGLIDSGDYYTNNTVISEEQYDVLLKLSLKRRNKLGKEKSDIVNNKNRELVKSSSKNASSFEELMINELSFASCETRLNKGKYRNVLDKIERDFQLLQIGNINLLKLPLYNSMNISKGTIVKHNYYYYTLSFRKKLVTTQCLATLIACKLSEAVNCKKIFKDTYLEIYKKHLDDYIKLIKSPPKKKKKVWYSIVSVPFGGMNRK